MDARRRTRYGRVDYGTGCVALAMRLGILPQALKRRLYHVRHYYNNHNFNASVLDLGSAIWLAERNDVFKFFENMSVRFLEFLKRNDPWKSRYNHNPLRVSRAIDSLRPLHSWELADWFYGQVKAFAGSSYDLMSDARTHWDRKASVEHDRNAGAFVGLSMGDALGAPVEFCRRGAFRKLRIIALAVNLICPQARGPMILPWRCV